MKKELKDLSDVHAIEVSKLYYSDFGEAPEELLAKSGKHIANEIGKGKITNHNIVDYLRSVGYNIPNNYAPIVGVGKSAEEYKFNLNDYFKFKPNDWMLKYWYEHYMKWSKNTIEDYRAKLDGDGYVSMQAHEFMNIFGHVMNMGSYQGDTNVLIKAKSLSPFPSYASQPIGKGAEEREESILDRAYKKMGKEKFEAAIAKIDGMRIQGMSFDEYMEELSTSITPTTNWDKVAAGIKDALQECGYIESNRPLVENRVEEIIATYLKQHIGGGDIPKTIYWEGFQTDVQTIIEKGIGTDSANQIGEDITNMARDNYSFQSLTAPASEQVDWDNVESELMDACEDEYKYIPYPKGSTKAQAAEIDQANSYNQSFRHIYRKAVQDTIAYLKSSSAKQKLI